MSYCPKITWVTSLTSDEKRFWNAVQKGETQSAIILRDQLIKIGFDPMDDHIMLNYTYNNCIMAKNEPCLAILNQFKIKNP